MSDLTVKISGMDELVSAFAKAPDIAKDEINVAIKKTILSLLAAARTNTPVDRGFLRGAGMQTTFENLKGVLENTAPYAIFVHEGTRPHFPPIEAIEPWASRHGIPAFLVARSIARKGTQGVPFFQMAIEDTQGEIDAYFSLALSNITKKLAT